MNKRIASVVVLIAVIIVAAWRITLQDNDAATVIVSRGSIDVTIQTIGQVQSTGSTPIRSRIGGEVEIVAVQPGDRVVEGDILVQLAREPFMRSRDDAQRAVEEAEFALQRAQRQAAEDPENEDLSFGVVQAEQTLANRDLVLADANEALANASISAPRDGIVLETPVREGDLVNRSQPVASIFARDDLQVIADVDELDLVNVVPGASATVRLDAYPAQEIEGTVVSTSPAAREQGGATVFTTTIEIVFDDTLDIRPGMNADVTIITDARDDVLLLPQNAIRTVGERAFVHVDENGNTVEREIILGYRSGGTVEVVSGLAEGDMVVLQ